MKRDKAKHMARLLPEITDRGFQKIAPEEIHTENFLWQIWDWMQTPAKTVSDENGKLVCKIIPLPRGMWSYGAGIGRMSLRFHAPTGSVSLHITTVDDGIWCGDWEGAGEEKFDKLLKLLDNPSLLEGFEWADFQGWVTTLGGYPDCF